MDYQKMAEFRNTHNPYAQRLGVTVEEIGPGCSRVTKTVTQADLNPVGLAHGGVYFSMADTACGSAAASYGVMAVTVSAQYNFLRSAHPGDTLTAEAQEVKRGKTICVFSVRICDQTGTLLGTGSFTFYLLDQKITL